MVNFTSNTYTLKRKILNFTNKISKRLSKPERKFTADMTYGMLATVPLLSGFGVNAPFSSLTIS